MDREVDIRRPLKGVKRRVRLSLPLCGLPRWAHLPGKPPPPLPPAPDLPGPSVNGDFVQDIPSKLGSGRGSESDLWPLWCLRHSNVAPRWLQNGSKMTPKRL